MNNMKKLAIEGHKTRGKEVIELLEMLGGKNNKNLHGYTSPGYYYIDYGEINCNILKDNYIVYTLEDFFQKFPFKVGDRVNIPEYESEVRINAIKWDVYSKIVLYMVYRVDEEEWYTTEELLDYNDIEDYKNIESKNIKSNNKETITIDDFKVNTKEIDDKIYINEHNSIDRNVNDICDDILINQITAKVAIINLKSDVYDDEVELNLGDYEIEIRDNKTYAVLKKPKYPKTYGECCRVLGMIYDYPDIKMVSIDEYTLYSSFIELIRCRDAYWKIAGKEIGCLEESWKPEFQNCSIPYYSIFINNKGKICKERFYGIKCLLIFPIEEMRDAFYENFKDLIEKCKKLL